MSDSHSSSFDPTAAWLIGLCGLAVGAFAILSNVRVHSSHVSPKVSGAEIGIKNIATAIRMYEIEHDALPDSLELLCIGDAERAAPLIRTMLEDPWGQPFEYRRTSTNSFEIRSGGPDRQMDTPDDLTN